MPANYGILNFECTDDHRRWNNLKLSTSRLESAYQEFKSYVPGHENLRNFETSWIRTNARAKTKITFTNKSIKLKTARRKFKATTKTNKNNYCEKTE